KGNGPQIVDWATGNGFTVDAHTRAHLLTYANASPIFMAAKYDTTSTENKQQQNSNNTNPGESTPVLLTMKTAHPWIPVEMLAVDGSTTSADFYLLTDQPLNIDSLHTKLGMSPVNGDIPNAPGLSVRSQKQLSDEVFHDLSNDAHMDWLWPNSWLTYLSLSADAEQVTYDLSISPSGVIHAAPFGTPPMAIVDRTISQELPDWLPTLPPGSFPYTILSIVILGAGILLFFLIRRRNSRKTTTTKTA
ncbi:MAG: hypothetical protein J2P37_16395, partial [Ktedonobacteraceae bacterium]|nr:hypothetical protein [Ktedonobacteraceae bacterium]